MSRLKEKELKPQDFRLGNIVTLSEKDRQDLWADGIEARNEFFHIDVIWSDGDVCLSLDYEDVEIPAKSVLGVEISEMTLKLFGFLKDGSEYKKGLWKLIPDYQHGKIIGYGLAIKLLDWTRLNQNSMIYIHQLQNLFFALCGEELELK